MVACLILLTFAWGPQERRGYVAIPPSFGPPRKVLVGTIVLINLVPIVRMTCICKMSPVFEPC